MLGLDDETFGQIVAAIVVIKDHSSLSHDDFREYLKSRLAPYKIPKVFKVVDSIPKNQLGKVNKKTVWADLKLIR